MMAGDNWPGQRDDQIKSIWKRHLALCYWGKYMELFDQRNHQDTDIKLLPLRLYWWMSPHFLFYLPPNFPRAMDWIGFLKWTFSFCLFVYLDFVPNHTAFSLPKTKKCHIFYNSLSHRRHYRSFVSLPSSSSSAADFWLDSLIWIMCAFV